MALGGFYNTGTITIAADRVSVTGVSTMWKTFQIEVGDWLLCNGQVNVVGIVVDDTHLTLQTQWQGTLPSAAAYTFVLMSWLRFDPSLTQWKLRELLMQLSEEGTFVFVDEAPPDPLVGNNGQWALQTNVSPWRLWYKDATGVWQEQASPAGLKWLGVWSSSTNYTSADAVTRNGSSYISKQLNNLGHPPPDAFWWDVLAQQGASGAAGPPGAGLIWRGAWAGATSYAVNDAVSAPNGSAYVCIVAHTSSVGFPPPNANWSLLAQGGTAAIADSQIDPIKLNADNSAEQLAFRNRLNFVSREGDTVSGDLIIAKVNPSLILNKTGNTLAGLYSFKDGVPRWVIQVASNTAEGGANSGSDISFSRYADTPIGGLPIDSPVIISRATGRISVLTDPQLPLELVTKRYVDTHIRDRMTGPRTYYVRQDGNNGNTGLTNNAGGAWRDIQYAWDWCQANLDLNNNYLTIQIGDGTWASPQTLLTASGMMVGQRTDSQVLISGNQTTWTNCVLQSDLMPVSVREGARIWLAGFRLFSTAGNCLVASFNGYVAYQNIDFYAGANAHVEAQKGGKTFCNGYTSLSLPAACHLLAADDGECFETTALCTIKTAMVFPRAFFVSSGGGIIICHPAHDWTGGNVVGKKFEAINQSQVNSTIPGVCPGDQPGTTDATSTFNGTVLNNG